MAVERDCLKLQNAGKHISANEEFQYFPAEHAPRPWQDPRNGLSNSLPVWGMGVIKPSCPPSVQNLNDTQVFPLFICLQEILFFPVT